MVSFDHLFFFPASNDPGALARPSWAPGSLLIFPLWLTRASSVAWSLLLGRAVDGTHSQEVVSEPGLLEITVGRVARSTSGGFSPVLAAARGSPCLGVELRVSLSPCTSLVEN